jgi:hypothetical protein
MNTAVRPRSLYWRRRGILLALGAAGMAVLIKSCAGGGPPHIPARDAAKSVPIVSTYTPTPTPTPTVTATLSPTGVPTVAPTVAPTATAGVRPNLTAVAPVAATPAPTAAATPAATPTVAPIQAVAAAPPIVRCATSALAVDLRTDAAIYSGHDKPKFYVGIKNIGAVPCKVDLGSVALSFTVHSGPDRIWSSRDCQGKGTHDVRTLKAGQQLWGRSIWNLRRSAPGCPKGLPDVKPGTYLLNGAAAHVKATKRIVFTVR